MKRLILTTSDTGGGCLKMSGLADMVIPFGLALIGEPPPSDAVLEELLSGSSKRRSTPLPRWADVVGRREREKIASKGLGLLDFCAQCETVELWVDPLPNAQLMLVWLLSCFRGHQAASKLKLVQANVTIGSKDSHEIARWVPPAVAITEARLEIASLAW